MTDDIEIVVCDNCVLVYESEKARCPACNHHPTIIHDDRLTVIMDRSLNVRMKPPEFLRALVYVTRFDDDHVFVTAVSGGLISGRFKRDEICEP